MATTQAAFKPLVGLIDSMRKESKSDKATIEALGNELEVVKTEVKAVEAENKAQLAMVDLLRIEIKSLLSSVKDQNKRIDTLDDSSVSHQAQLDPLVADHRRKRDRSPAPPCEPVDAKSDPMKMDRSSPPASRPRKSERLSRWPSVSWAS